MAKKIEKVYYECETCRKAYCDIKGAEECEKRHKHIINMKEHFREGEEYPNGITVEFENGDKCFANIGKSY